MIDRNYQAAFRQLHTLPRIYDYMNIFPRDNGYVLVTRERKENQLEITSYYFSEGKMQKLQIDTVPYGNFST